MSGQNKARVHRYCEAVWNQSDFATVDELVVRDFVGHQPRAEANGPAAAKHYRAMLRAAFPDIHFMIPDQIAEGDKVVTRWTVRARHTGEYRGIPSTGKQGLVTGITLDRIGGGQSVQSGTNFAEVGMMQQLGVIPAPPRA